MPPAWKVRRGHLVIGLSVRPSVCLSVCLSVCPPVCPSVCNSVPLTIKVQYLKFGWWYNYQTWTVSSSKGCSHFTDITRPWGVGQGQNVGLRDFCHNWTLLPPGHTCFTNTFLVFCFYFPKTTEISTIFYSDIIETVIYSDYICCKCSPYSTPFQWQYNPWHDCL